MKRQISLEHCQRISQVGGLSISVYHLLRGMCQVIMNKCKDISVFHRVLFSLPQVADCFGIVVNHCFWFISSIVKLCIVERCSYCVFRIIYRLIFGISVLYS